MSYCNPGDKPTITYKFGNGVERTAKINSSPIDVTVTSGANPTGTTENFSPEGYQLTFYSPNNYKYISVVVRDYRIVDKGYLELNTIDCDSTGFSNEGVTIDPNTISIDTSIRCPVVSNECMIKATYNGATIFTDKGDCPCTFKVYCARCPDGYCECPTSAYPGYCCISCQELAAQIRGITNSVRSLNNG